LSRDENEAETRGSLAAVVAMTPSGVIGRDGDMPWRLRTDLRRFKKLTMGGVLIMGRRTYESIGRPLPGRRTVVLTRNPHWAAEGVETVSSPDEAIAAIGKEAGYLVGGGEIYQVLLAACQRVFLTRVLAKLEGDTVVDLDLSDFRIEEITRFPASKHDEFPTEFLTMARTSR
jgi:dihydrofolate reductase